MTQSGIVVGADGKLSVKKWNYQKKKYEESSSIGTKARLLKNHAAIASDGHLSLPHTPGHYDFFTWTDTLDQHIRETTTVDELAEIVQTQILLALAPLNGHLQDVPQYAGSNYFSEYVIAGYQAGIPKVYCLVLRVDLKTNTLVPDKQIMRFPWYQLASHDTQDQLEKPGSDLSKRFEGKLPNVLARLRQGQPALAFYEGSDAVRLILQFEADANSDAVGFPLTLVNVPKYGHGWVCTYKQRFALPSKTETPRCGK
jgi:hypothetical protein